MRRLSSLVAAAALLGLLLPATAAAAVRTTEHITSVGCNAESDLGTLFVFAESNDSFGPFAELGFWEVGLDPTFDPPTLLGFGEEVEATADSLTATIQLFVETTGEPAGEATLDLDLAPMGDPTSFSENGREGNRWWRITGTDQALDVAGSASLDGIGDFDLATGCFGTSAVVTTVANAPASAVNRFNDAFIGCGWETEESFVFFNIFVNQFEGFADFGSFSETTNVSGFGEGSIGGGTFSATFEIFDNETEEAVGSGSASGTATIVGGRSRFVESDGLSVAKIVSQTLDVQGTLTVEIDGVVEEIALDSESCVGETRSIRTKFVAPKGPRARVLANDAPDGAVALRKLPAKVLTNTGMTSPDAEVPCIIDLGGGETEELPIGSTAWWTFTGNGRDVTVNTARSSFDTVLAVYTWDGSDFVPVACVDDVFGETFSLLARATFDTEAGERYYIQAGGFGGQAGRLQLTVR